MIDTRGPFARARSLSVMRSICRSSSSMAQYLRKSAFVIIVCLLAFAGCVAQMDTPIRLPTAYNTAKLATICTCIVP
jgi:hypothetical protein